MYSLNSFSDFWVIAYWQICWNVFFFSLIIASASFKPTKSVSKFSIKSFVVNIEFDLIFAPIENPEPVNKLTSPVKHFLLNPCVYLDLIHTFSFFF